MPELRRAGEVMEQVGRRPPGTFVDEDVELLCPRGGEWVLASAALLGLKGRKSVYECRQHRRALLTITPGLLFTVHCGMKLHVEPGD